MGEASLRRHLGNERGATLIIAGFALTAIFGAMALALDVAMLQSARAQAQRAADAGALAGVSAFLDGATDLQDEAEDRTIGMALQNEIRGTQIAAGEVSVSVNESEGRVTVVIDRPAVSTLFARILGVDAVRVSARATAQASEVSSSSCLKPWAAPDPELTGAAPFVNGQSIILKGDTPGGEAYPWVIDGEDLEGPCLGGGGGTQTGPAYRSNICNCNLLTVNMGPGFRRVSGTPGNLRPHTDGGVNGLVAQDPGAFWDVGARRVAGSSFPNWRQSPRIVTMPLYDPGTPEWNRTFTRLVRVFVESTDDGVVSGRYVGSLRVLQLVE